MLIEFDNINFYKFLICLDCEFTCWEDSLRLDWPDPEFPPEVIHIGLSVLDTVTLTAQDEFMSYVSPKVNTTLSQYCKNLLEITQNDIDNANDFSDVLTNIDNFLDSFTPSNSLACSFGPDFVKIAANARQQSLDDPFIRYKRLDLRREAGNILGCGDQQISRELVYKYLGLSKCPNRHDALSDARDLARIIRALRNYQVPHEAKVRNLVGIPGKTKPQ